MSWRLDIALNLQLAMLLLACSSSAPRQPADDAGAAKSEHNGSKTPTASSDAAAPEHSAADAAAAAESGGGAAPPDAGRSSSSGTGDAGRVDNPPEDDAGATDAADDAGPASVSCVQEPATTSSCKYLVSSGTAVVTRLDAVDPARENSCPNDPVKVTFVWHPDNPESTRCAADAKGGMERSSWMFQVGDGKHPPRSCIDGASIAVGSRLPVLRRDIVSGACTPVVFDFGPLAERCRERCFSSDAGSANDGLGCTTSGGTISTSSCCSSVSDFPNTCAIGACGCAPENSHEVQTCECPAGECFDGSHCVNR